jgi:hypothetical protein
MPSAVKQNAIMLSVMAPQAWLNVLKPTKILPNFEISFLFSFFVETEARKKTNYSRTFLKTFFQAKSSKISVGHKMVKNTLYSSHIFFITSEKR